ncbi:hypothetical protein AWW66_02100 [Micromonospora rosaria]|uniref:Uncharacterized protein n=1 Tax=Micromonospora rosaria TaxID=47874 RepID=A0A136PYM0_9ACTN|nr:hypothetical protein [Micromonospora rosaria]KXK63568.1 hypothetical protein AWW66_02100 [Micromonospora rosaria]
MGSSYQTILAAGDLTDVRAAVTESGQRAVVVPVGERRWAVVPAPADGGYAETEELARLLSRPAGAVAAAFDVFDSDVVVARLFRDGRGYHDYLSEQSHHEEAWDDDDNEILFDMLGRPYPPGATLPTGPYGADPAAFVPLGVAPVDEVTLEAALAGPEPLAEVQHHRILRALNLRPGPLATTYDEAVAAGLGV